MDYKMFIKYAAKFYSNFGNYFSYGRSKFIPELPQEQFEEILKSSDCYENDIKYIWECVRDIVYDDSLEFKTINLSEKKGKNSFYLGDIRLENINEIDEYLKKSGKDPRNTRLTMIDPNKFCYLVSSIEEKIEDLDSNNRIIGYYGEFSEFLKRVNYNLEKAKSYCMNDTQIKIIDQYIESFQTGSIDNHQDSQLLWIQDKKSNIEFNLGWIYHLLDPMRNRCSFEVREIINLTKEFLSYISLFLLPKKVFYLNNFY